MAPIQGINFFSNPIKGIENVGERFGAMKTRRVEGGEGVNTPYQAIASTNCELTPNVNGGGYTHGVGAFASTKNWMF